MTRIRRPQGSCHRAPAPGKRHHDRRRQEERQEKCVQCAVGHQPGKMATRAATDRLETASNDNAAVRLNHRGKDFVVWPGAAQIEAGIDSAVVIQATKSRAAARSNNVIAGSEDLAIGVSGGSGSPGHANSGGWRRRNPNEPRGFSRTSQPRDRPLTELNAPVRRTLPSA